MSKAVLVIDMPEHCYECPCFMNEGWRCQCRLDINEEVHDERPTWCPLRPHQEAIPVEWIKKQKVDFQNEDHPFNYCRGFQDGYNDCIDYLISEWEEEQASLFEKQITEECTSAERFADWEKENERDQISEHKE